MPSVIAGAGGARLRWYFTSWSSETASTITAPVKNVLQVASMPKKIRPLRSPG